MWSTRRCDNSCALGMVIPTTAHTVTEVWNSITVDCLDRISYREMLNSFELNSVECIEPSLTRKTTERAVILTVPQVAQ